MKMKVEHTTHSNLNLNGFAGDDRRAKNLGQEVNSVWYVLRVLACILVRLYVWSVLGGILLWLCVYMRACVFLCVFISASKAAMLCPHWHSMGTTAGMILTDVKRCLRHFLFLMHVCSGDDLAAHITHCCWRRKCTFPFSHHFSIIWSMLIENECMCTANAFISLFLFDGNLRVRRKCVQSVENCNTTKF